jgi:uncharacterized NAD-dependent epimerase/dehydratase family protein
MHKINVINCDIVIIDSGLNLNNAWRVPGICIEKTNDGFCVSDKLTDEIGHGTIIYSVINKQVDTDRIYIVKLSERDDHDESHLITALEYIKQNVNCKIINISLGLKTGENISKLYNICKEISAMGIVIISAFDNEGCHSYPAAFDCVIGVDNKDDIKHITEFDFVENSPINILAKGNVQRLTVQEGKTLLVSGSSIACAHITSIIADKITDGFDLQSALSYLKSKSRYIYSSHKPEKDIGNSFFEITNAVVFPFAKEAHAFLRFADMLSFHIQGYYDVRYSGKVGKQLASYCEDTASVECIMDIERIDFAGVDAIILGHLDELNALSGRDYKTELIKKAITARVNVYSFDPLDQYADLLNTSDIKYFYPKVIRYSVPQNTFGKLYRIPKPVVGIFGTSSKQGKFSLQLALKKELESRDYDVGAIGTEPHSLLFDFGVVFPMGYNSTVYLQNDEVILYLNNEINNLCLRGKEIILVATQAQIVPYYCNNLLEFPSMQYHFALGTRPDVIIMCINYHDEIPYIRNSMYALMGLTDATIVAFVMHPITYSSDWNGIYGNSRHKITYEEFKQKADTLRNEFQIPVFMLGDQQHMGDLCQVIIDFF